jgi:hypothetical protein
MAHNIRRVDYYYTTIKDHPGEAYKILSQLAELGINLLAFSGVPVGPERTQLTLFPEDESKMISAGQRAGLDFDGPHPALLVQGDDVLGALAGIHGKLYDARVNVFASSAVTDGRGSYGYILFVRPEQLDRALNALEM